MKCFIRGVTALATVLAALTTATVPPATAADAAAKFKAGDTAPDFTLQDLGGRQVQLSEVTKSKVVLLAFWSLRCGTCLKEVPYLEQLHKSYGERGVAILSVVTDGADAPTTKIIMQETGIAPSYPVLVDPDFTVSDIYTNFLVPHTLIIDRKGLVRYVHTGFESGTEKDYEAALAEALGS